MLSIAFCDDEPIMLEELFNVVKGYIDSKKVEFTADLFESGEEFVEKGVRCRKYDIVFLDIEMKEMNGLEAAAWFRKLNEQSKVIFVSSHVEYTLDAFKVAAFRYIIKNKDTMTQAVQEALDACLDINPEIKQVKKYHFTELDMFLQTEDIIYIESILHDLKFHIQAENNYVFTLARCTLNIWEQENHWNGFVRIHQSYLVNMKYVYAYNSKEVELLDGTVLTISKQRKTEVCKLFRDQAIPRQKAEIHRKLIM